jgi:hypothetical protein
VTTAVSSAELETQLVNADPAKVAADPAGFGKLVKNYVDANRSRRDQGRGRAGRCRPASPTSPASPRRSTAPAPTPDVRPVSKFHNSAKAPGAELDGKFENLAEVFSLLRDERRDVRTAQDRSVRCATPCPPPPRRRVGS